MRRSLLDPPEDDPPELEYINIAILVLFVFELIVRIIGFRMAFFIGEERNWNAFDSLVVGFSVAETFLLKDVVKMSDVVYSLSLEHHYK